MTTDLVRLVHEIDRLKMDKWAEKGFTVSLRTNVLSDIPFEAIVPWLFDRIAARGIVAYDYTKFSPTKRNRDKAMSVGLYLVDSVHERTTPQDFDTMDRPVVRR